jgi:hypothetical protein
VDPATSKAKVEAATKMLEGAAAELGATLGGNTARALAERALSEGWSGDQARMATELSGYINAGEDLTGTAGDQEDLLRGVAFKNGVSFDDAFFRKGAIDVVGGRSNSQAFEDQIREQAAKKYAAWAPQIKTGIDVRTLASSHLQSMAKLLEIDESNLDMDDPLLKAALQGLDADNNPAVKTVADFEKSIKQDSRWQMTANAKDELTGVGYDMLRRFGMVG